MTKIQMPNFENDENVHRLSITDILAQIRAINEMSAISSAFDDFTFDVKSVSALSEDIMIQDDQEESEQKSELLTKFSNILSVSTPILASPDEASRFTKQPSTINPTRFKTKLCSLFRKNNCHYGTRCLFAHSLTELRDPEVVGTTTDDHALSILGGSSAPEILSSDSQSNSAKLYKTKPCAWFKNGKCVYENYCRFVHEE